MIECELIVQESYDDDNIANVTVRIKNTSSDSLRILKWNTPFEGLKSDMFIIKKGKSKSSALLYEGILVKRGKPKEKDFFNLLPQQSTECSINILEGYSISQEGQYRISTDFFISVETANGLELIRCKSKSRTTHFSNTKKKTRQHFYDEFNKLKQKLYLNEFDFNLKKIALVDEEIYEDSKKEDLKALFIKLLDCLKKAINHFHKLSSAAYLKWFGLFNEYRWRKVYFNIVDIYILVTNYSIEIIEYSGGCKDGDLAYVHLGKCKINLCEEFWELEDCGRDSKLGALLHELSHLAARTIDKTYGVEACRQIAKGNPMFAIKNADNYEYFFEDICCNITD